VRGLKNSLQTKIFIGFGILICLFLINSGIFYASFKKVTKGQDDNHLLLEKQRLLSDLEVAVIQSVMPANDYLITGDYKEKENHKTSPFCFFRWL